MSLPKPYYQDDRSGITIYHGDNRDILPHIEPVDLVLTDPPYIGLKGGFEYWGCGGVSPYLSKSSPSIGDPWKANLDWTEIIPEHSGIVVFCSYTSVPEVALAFPKHRRVALITWYKRNSPPSGKNVPRFTTEFVWCLSKKVGIKWDEIKNTMIDIPKLSTGCMASPERFIGKDGKAEHPTQKPLALISKFIFSGCNTILDPFMGSGTTLRAAKDFGRKAIGIEIEERYAEIAAKRLEQDILPISFDSTEKPWVFPI